MGMYDGNEVMTGVRSMGFPFVRLHTYCTRLDRDIHGLEVCLVLVQLPLGEM